MHGIVFLDTRRQVKTAPRLVRGFQGLQEDSVTDDHDILQRIEHADKDKI
jgi:hypothetical protein